jgi:uncharacterized DUF497 family protein
MSAPYDLQARLVACLQDIRQRRIFAGVRYVFDSAKDAANRAKHGVSLALAEILFAGPHRRVVDDRFDYGEVREVAFGLINARLFVCVFADRRGERRVISLRKANRREVRRYGQGKT